MSKVLTPLNLDPHQIQGFKFILDNPKNFIMWSMGLGKTPTTLTAYSTLLNLGYINKVLIISHPSIVSTVWQSEATVWSQLSGLSFRVIEGTKKKREIILNNNIDTDFDIISVFNLGWLLKYANIGQYDALIIDESSLFKAYNSKRFKEIKLLKKQANFEYITLLSGTPNPNSYQDLWSQIFILDDGELLGKNITTFRRKFMIQGYQEYIWDMRDNAGDEIKELIKPLCLNSDIVIDTPRVRYIDVDINLSKSTLSQIKHFKETGLITTDIVKHNRLLDLFKEYKKLDNSDNFDTAWKHDEEMQELLNDMDVSENVITIYSRLLTLSSGFYYNTLEDDTKETKFIHDEKIKKLKEIVELHDTENFIIVYNFKEEKNMILKSLPKDDTTQYDKKWSKKIIDAWKRKTIKYLVVHSKSISHGVNGLQIGGHNLIWFSPTTSLETYLQMNKRIDRRGQTKNPNIFKFIATPSEKLVYNTLEKKDMSQKELLSAMVKYLIQGDKDEVQ